MSKQIVIIGGGISGLAVLHFLRQRFPDRSSVHVELLEKTDRVGGTIGTRQDEGTQFETGPNGFLDNQPSTLDVVRELGLEGQLVRASDDAKIRYIRFKGKLHALPTSPVGMLRFSPLSLGEKFRILMEPLVASKNDGSETVYDFGRRRLGRRFSELFLDPMVSGIFAGDINELNLRAAFPKIFQLEQEYGSLFKALLRRKREGRASAAPAGQPGGSLCSFRHGMSQLIEALSRRYASDINTAEGVQSLQRAGEGYCVETPSRKYYADEVFMCCPAYAAAECCQTLQPELSDRLQQIPYAPLAVVGMVYRRDAFKCHYPGFGYLIPSLEHSPVLGVLFTHNLFPLRIDQSHYLFRVMLGGQRSGEVVRQDEQTLVHTAQVELQQTLEATEPAVRTYSKVWPRAIPQYTTAYCRILEDIESMLTQHPHLHIVANYRGGISMNDCIKNAKNHVAAF